MDATSDTPWLLVGLGNPGPRYAGNRHNAGFLVVDVLASRCAASFKRHCSRADVAEDRVAGTRCVLAKPQTYMNESGAAVAGLSGFYKVPPERLVVVHDELDLDYGQLRVKFAGGDNGHNGLKSIRRSLGHGDYYRMRFGVGRPPGRQDPIDFLLRDFSAAERKDLDYLVDRTADAVESLLVAGLEQTQTSYNTRGALS
ncbi:MAG: aminoacyl-tRNA hydrolase [Streptosporangiales bacterium]|nr:aminoacyl-tRNA hydrolase [Streptosporangiales bacterium]